MDFEKVKEAKEYLYDAISCILRSVPVRDLDERMCALDSALAELEKPADEKALSVVKNWDAKHRGRYATLDSIYQELARDIEQYTENYASKKCKDCGIRKEYYSDISG